MLRATGNDKSKSGNKLSNPCRSKPNGVYANLETGCADLFQFAHGTKTDRRVSVA